MTRLHTEIEACPNGCGDMRTLRSGVGHITVNGYRCNTCGYTCRPVRAVPPADWERDRTYAAGYAYASGCAE